MIEKCKLKVIKQKNQTNFLPNVCYISLTPIKKICYILQKLLDLRNLPLNNFYCPVKCNNFCRCSAGFPFTIVGLGNGESKCKKKSNFIT